MLGYTDWASRELACMHTTMLVKQAQAITHDKGAVQAHLYKPSRCMAQYDRVAGVVVGSRYVAGRCFD